MDAVSQPSDSDEPRLEETIGRARRYLSAGADCVYPITLNDLGLLKRLREAIDAPVPTEPNPAFDAEVEAAAIKKLQ